MNKVMCYRVKEFLISEYEFVKETTCQITYLNHIGTQITEDKEKYNFENIKLFRFKYDALKWLERKHLENIKASVLVDSKEALRALKYATEFYKHCGDLDKYKI